MVECVLCVLCSKVGVKVCMCKRKEVFDDDDEEEKEPGCGLHQTCLTDVNKV